jgi:chromate transporter
LCLSLLGGGLLVMLSAAGCLPRPAGGLLPLPGAALITTGAAKFSLFRLFWSFLKIGLLLYGSGYVLFAFLQAELVERHAWLTEQELIDAIAFGQMTPGPLSTSATFIGYLLAGVPGALIATFGLYLPAFVIVAVSHPLSPRIRPSRRAGGFLDGVNVAALGLIAAVAWGIGARRLRGPYTILIGIVAAGLLLQYNLNSVVLVLFGAGMGLLSAVV